MFNTRFRKYSLAPFLAASMLLVSVFNVSSAELTQRDWLVTLIDTTGWQYGLPDEPQDPDYINILTGNREFRFEAEDCYDKDRDNVSVMSFRNFGDFSGSGWLNGSRAAVDTHLSFNLPLSGHYQIRANIRQPGHKFLVGQETVTADAGDNFAVVSVGEYYLDAGPQTIIVTLPPGGSIDFISLSAPNHAIISPPGGWDPDASLTWRDINTTLLQLYKLADIFPLSERQIMLEAEDYRNSNTKVVTTSYLGRASEGKWLQAGPRSAEFEIPLKGLQSGFYNMTLRMLGKKATITIGEHHTIRLEGKIYLDDYTFPALYFTGSENNISIRLSPGAGVDQLLLTKSQVDLTQVATLFNLQQNRPPTTEDLNTIAALLAAFGVAR